MTFIFGNTNIEGRRLKRPPLPETLTGTTNPAALGASTLTIPVPGGFLYRIKGIEIIAAANQTILDTEIRDTATVPNTLGTLRTTRTQLGSSVRWYKDRVIRGRQFPVVFYFSAGGGGAGINMMDDFEFPVGVTIRRAYWHSVNGTGAVAFTVDVTVGAAAAVAILNNLGANVLVMENENLNINVPANTDVLVEFNDAGIATTEQTLVLWCEINEEQIDFNSNEYVPITLHRGITASGLTVNIMDDLETTENLVIRRAYAQVGVAPAAAFTVDFLVNGYNLGCQILGAAVIAENENLAVPLAADVDNIIQIIDSGGASTDYTLVLWCQRTDPISGNENPYDVQDRYGNVWCIGGDNIVINFTQAVAAQAIVARVYCEKVEFMN